ncbi:MAG: DUF4230 domain-containing protein [Candidatus Aminicenantes bacterium]|nr:DUF4230 domain-containing protein [Candidatus Aminicenantes bacterium]NIM80727.1 DUF4230 domain-containing protein [Candidatus Aminicenantes bacterium]NIN20102.1 DUF4230 domain-containing protein [Candidatus Aminicenantes bacterium]NIN43889.1 DUF4230 domain-containing protein [Candidatus Aminicenantes bacterium]NIN86698.1 DUF4230 domain-containing protein [Candidatus Aminicenantes bacterium]
MRHKIVLLVIMIFLLSLFFPQCSRAPKQRTLILNKIKKVAKLATVKFVIKKVVVGKKEKRLAFFIQLKDATFLAYTKAFIEAGIDLNKIEPDDIKVDNKQVELKLPPVEVVNFSYPPEEMKPDMQYTENKFLNKFKLSDIESFYRMAEAEIRAYVNHLGIKEAAETKTRVFMEKLLKQMGFEEIYIHFKSSNKPLMIYDPDVFQDKD